MVYILSAPTIFIVEYCTAQVGSLQITKTRKGISLQEVNMTIEAKNITVNLDGKKVLDNVTFEIS